MLLNLKSTGSRVRGVSERRVSRPRESIHRDPASANHHHHHHHHKQQQQQHCEQLNRCFYAKMADTDNSLSYLLPAKRDAEIISSLRSAREYPSLSAKTTRFKKSFIPKYQREILCNCVITLQFCCTLVSIRLTSCHIK